MFCSKCEHDLEQCTCLDLAERMRSLSGLDGPMIARWCQKCDNHYAACRCEVPKWVARSNGRYVLLPKSSGSQFKVTDLSGGLEA